MEYQHLFSHTATSIKASAIRELLKVIARPEIISFAGGLPDPHLFPQAEIEHINAVNKLREINISEILTAHDYYPYGYHYIGKENISKALDACVDPLMDIQKLIFDNPSMDDEEICALYNSGTLPTLAVKVVTAVRNM